MSATLKTSLARATAAMNPQVCGPRLLRTSLMSARRSYATAMSLATHQTISNLLNDSIAAGKHTVTAIQCTVLQQPESNVLRMQPRPIGPGEEDTKVGFSSSEVQEAPEKMVKVQAMVELVVKAKDFGEVEGMGLLGRE
ncbi:uncharacterized protein MYCFIDRAFT_211185 [Pseudocercospora fijiensis CIRAD86]|uniref:Uncharacterized protein n=1 Tax=Pseudocercospora fijiensis (strain CIRAD86) TaxID=383855 RepID=M2ZV47_PSEFD|nr:uncharacterized protein MYCFIDRAFT_211185 [Pseudocercospora fijiensis CIRAD86]EME82879.1 hypothetical protein MYCFIDRAFT_211185 [Pseudocercospora fijiensis CIRAD86]